MSKRLKCGRMDMQRRDWPPRRVLVIPDKFRGTLTSAQAGRAIVRGLRAAWPNTQLTRLELSDGGDGFARLLVSAAGGTLRRARTIDAAGRPCSATWGSLSDGRAAVVDIASASGLARLPEPLRDPTRTSSYGTGLLIGRAIDAGARTIIVGLGGSATNDGGIGIAAALGFRFLDQKGKDVPLTGAGLSRLASIQKPERLPRVRFVAATDVDNPLYGPLGAASQFAPQKGASPRRVRELDRGLRTLAAVVQHEFGRDLANEPGAGAAGGCGFALMTFFSATRVSGFDVIREYLRLDALIGRQDLIVTGEGCFDRTSLNGKGPARVAALARSRKIPVWGVFGQIRVKTKRSPFDSVAAIEPKPMRDVPRLSPAVHARKLADTTRRLALHMERITPAAGAAGTR